MGPTDSEFAPQFDCWDYNSTTRQCTLGFNTTDWNNAQFMRLYNSMPYEARFFLTGADGTPSDICIPSQGIVTFGVGGIASAKPRQAGPGWPLPC
ncbi:hypothetical protein GCM10009583_08640 [Ornithinicoccus hortensis]